MCGGRETSFPLPGGGVIANLEPGDEIIVKAGFGFPQAESDSRHIVAAVRKFSALTADGVALHCHDGLGVEPTGNHHNTYELSSEAKEILSRVGQEEAA